MITRKKAEAIYNNAYKLRKKFETENNLKEGALSFIEFIELDEESDYLELRIYYNLYSIRDEIGDLINKIKALQIKLDNSDEEIEEFDNKSNPAGLNFIYDYLELGEEDITYWKNIAERLINRKYVLDFFKKLGISDNDYGCAMSEDDHFNYWFEDIILEIEKSDADDWKFSLN